MASSHHHHHPVNSLLCLFIYIVTFTTQAVLPVPVAPVPSTRLQRRGITEYTVSTQRFCTLFHYQMGGYVKVEGRKVGLNTESHQSYGDKLIFQSVDVGKVTIQDPITKHYICLGHRHLTVKTKLRKNRCVFSEEHMQYLDSFYIPVTHKLNDGRIVKRKHYLTFKKGKSGKVRGVVSKGNRGAGGDLKRQFIRVCRHSGADDSERRFRYLFNKVETGQDSSAQLITVEKSKKRRHKKNKKGGSKKKNAGGGEHGGKRRHDRTKLGSS